MEGLVGSIAFRLTANRFGAHARVFSSDCATRAITSRICSQKSAVSGTDVMLALIYNILFQIYDMLECLPLPPEYAHMRDEIRDQVVCIEGLPLQYAVLFFLHDVAHLYAYVLGYLLHENSTTFQFCENYQVA